MCTEAEFRRGFLSGSANSHRLCSVQKCKSLLTMLIETHKFKCRQVFNFFDCLLSPTEPLPDHKLTRLYLNQLKTLLIYCFVNVLMNLSGVLEGLCEEDVTGPP